MYSCHHHLIIRPDNIWSAILTKLSIYNSWHAEELSWKFVIPTHTEKKEIVMIVFGDRLTADHGSVADKMTLLLEGNVKDLVVNSPSLAALQSRLEG